MEMGENIPTLNLPLRGKVEQLKAGETYLLSGRLITGRDAAHRRLYEALSRGESLPLELDGETIYYVGPCPPPPGMVIGSAGPTTSSRMDSYTPSLLKAGLVAMIGKGQRSPEVIKAITEAKAVYFAAIGGAGALLASKIVYAEVAAYPDLGPEAIYRLEVRDFPVIVAVDSQGNNLYRSGPSRYRIDPA